MKEINKLSDKGFQNSSNNNATELGKRVDVHCDNFTRELVILTNEPPDHTVQYLK